MDVVYRSTIWLLVPWLCACDVVFQLERSQTDTTSSGCADGTREGFVDLEQFPDIAGCAGAWLVPGVKVAAAPSCDREAGNGGQIVLGSGCGVSDLCAEGWDICSGRLDVISSTTAQSCDGVVTNEDLVLFITRQSGPGGGKCDATGLDDVFGCGTIGPLADASCKPLDRSSDNDCFGIRSLGGWSCFGPNEASTITKTDPTRGGGVMCCRAAN